jgi:spore coat polysaccharide biosynthesis protein SpsF
VDRACESQAADAVVRITADCPFTDPEVVDQVVRRWRETGVDYAANTLEPRSYPDGLDVEVISAAALRATAEAAIDAGDREHVTAFIRSHPERFTSAGVRLEPPLGNVRITLDTHADMRTLVELVREVGVDASMREVLQALGIDPALIAPVES